MHSTAAAGNLAHQLPDLLQRLDAVHAAEQISRLASDAGCAFDCVQFVLRELSTVSKYPNASRADFLPILKIL